MKRDIEVRGEIERNKRRYEPPWKKNRSSFFLTSLESRLFSISYLMLNCIKDIGGKGNKDVDKANIEQTREPANAAGDFGSNNTKNRVLWVWL